MRLPYNPRPRRAFLRSWHPAHPVVSSNISLLIPTCAGTYCGLAETTEGQSRLLRCYDMASWRRHVSAWAAAALVVVTSSSERVSAQNLMNGGSMFPMQGMPTPRQTQ